MHLDGEHGVYNGNLNDKTGREPALDHADSELLGDAPERLWNERAGSGMRRVEARHGKCT